MWCREREREEREGSRERGGERAIIQVRGGERGKEGGRERIYIEREREGGESHHTLGPSMSRASILCTMSSER